ncbi:MAG: glycoside hydrolase 43 family protein [Puniceicoccaceae bacterium]
MKTTTTVKFFCGLMLSLPAVAAAAEPAQNPILWMDVPDVAMVRVEDTYYMSSTTMHMNPGLPLMRSKDLVSWDLVSYAYDTLVDNAKMRLEEGERAYGAGSWASSLRYHEGTYYATTFSSTSGKTHVFTTDDIESGQWESFEFEPMLHDHTLVFDDDGRVYMIYGAGSIRLVELNPGARGIKAGTEEKVIIENATLVAGGTPGLSAEGSQLIKVNGWYYLFHITWPREDMRTVLVHRAKSIQGPWEGRVAFKDRGIAQGSIIDTPEGDWYAYLFRDYGAVGRIPYLVPMTWQDGWPVIGVDGKAPDTLPMSAPEQPLGNIVTSDSFDRSAGDPDFPLAWQWNHNPVREGWSLTERPGHLRLRSVRLDAHVLEARNMLTQRTFGPFSSASTRLDLKGLQVGDRAGLIALQRHYGWIGVQRREHGFHLVVEQVPESEAVIVAEAALPAGVDSVELRIDGDFEDRKDIATFYYRLSDRDPWTRIGPELQMRYTLPHFMGYRFGLFHYATESLGGYSDFDEYRVTGER